MTDNFSFISPLKRLRLGGSLISLWAFTLAVCIAVSAQDATTAQEPQQPAASTGKIMGGYVVHQSVDLGGHIAEHSGSDPMYDTLINIQSGPRILDQTFTMRAVDPAHAIFFDQLSSSSFGYGGDPINVTYLNMSKGRIYDFRGSYRRYRQYFDYDLLANPLIPPNSNPFVPILSSPHLFNTLRQITDLNLTLAPLSKVSVRFGFNHNINQGPSYSTVHVSTDALLYQNWRNSTDTWTGGVDWKPDPKTTFSYDQFVTYYKGNTSWGLAGLNYTLSNGTPVSLGVNLSSVWGTPCSSPFNPDGTVNPTCNAFLGYTRSAPTRTLFPTEQARFQTSAIPNFTLNGRLLYNGSNMSLSNYYENFNGLSSKSGVRQTIITGSAEAQRVNVNGDIAAVWQITPRISASDVFDFWYFRIPGTNMFTETDYAGTSMLQPPGAPTTTTYSDYQALNQKTKANTFVMAWDVTPRASLSVGYRYRSRLITDSAGDFIPIHENWGLFGAALRPTPELRVNLNFDGMYADNAFTRISPRQIQHYKVRAIYKPHTWLSVSGAVNIYEARNNVETVNHLEHNRDYSFGASIVPSEKWSIDLSYSYDSVYSTTIECYPSTPPPPGAGTAYPLCVEEGTPYQSNGYYNQPTQFGSIGFTFSPVKRVHLNAGYRMSAVNGNSEMINIRQVPGSLQSQFQSPYGGVAAQLWPNWTWKADYNYYGYGEGTPIGPTLARSFRGNVYTFTVNYAF
jgi:opacity protein-like surface antigen